MTEQFEQQLLGYVLDALTEVEREEVEHAIDRNPSLVKELDRLQGMLAPLAEDAELFDPPPGLAEATCAMIAGLDTTSSRFAESDFEAVYGEDGDRELDDVVRKIPVAKAMAAASNGHSNGNGKHADNSKADSKSNDKKVGLSPATAREMGGVGRRFRVRELVTVFALASVALAMIFPAISYSRHNAQVAGCQNNLRELGLSLTMYSRSHDSYFPVIPTGQDTAEERKAGVAGIFATRLWEDGFLTDSRLLTCPAVPHQGDGVIIPSMQELAASEIFLREFQTKMAGDYGYNLGHVSGGKYVPTRNFSRDYFPIMGDTPSLALDGRMGDNHGIFGQNILFESGRAAFVRRPDPDGDSWVGNFFTNDDGKVAAGKHWGDAVIAPSFARPNVFAANLK